jgi:putative restriction endonuclease
VIRLAERIGRTPSAVARKLGNLAHLDPALKARGVSGLTHGSKIDREVWDAAHQNWEKFVEEASAFEDDLRFWPPVVPTGPERQTETQATVRVRRGQEFFRAAVIRSYRSSCAMCEMDEERLLRASHIKPWAVAIELRLDPRNGISLCAIHDAAFDAGYISIGTQLEWVFCKRMVSKFEREPFDTFFRPFSGKRMHLPERWLPDVSFLNWHRENIFLAD